MSTDSNPPSLPVTPLAAAGNETNVTFQQSADAIACDIFCAVVDNFGDIGVCWRLARQLATEHGWQVRLFVDDLHAFQRLCPTIDPARVRQQIDELFVEHWHTPAHAGDTLTVADVVIEAFACELPPVYLAAMAQRQRVPVWFNLDYLSGEDWVAEFHLRPSPHPRYPLVKHFFFPGLGPGTGGVLKERTLDATRDAFDASSTERAQWWQSVTGNAPPGRDAIVVSLFAYENPAVDGLLAQWRDGGQPVVLLVPEGRISGAVARFFGRASFKAGEHAAAGNLRAHALAFTDQAGYDRLLWASDVNFVRGEDSFVRAQWAARPFVWHIYPQADEAHLPKLDAALAHYAGRCAGDSADHSADDLTADSSGLTGANPTAAPAGRLAPDAAATLERFWHAWNAARPGASPDWADLLRHRAALEARARDWARELAMVGDLAGNLAGFAKTQLK